MVHLFEFFVVPILTTGGDRSGLYLYGIRICCMSCGRQTCADRFSEGIGEAIVYLLKRAIIFDGKVEEASWKPPITDPSYTIYL